MRNDKSFVADKIYFMTIFTFEIPSKILTNQFKIFKDSIIWFLEKLIIWLILLADYSVNTIKAK